MPRSPAMLERGRHVGPALALLALAGAPQVDAVTLRVHPDSASVVGYPYFATLLAANAAAAPGDSVEVSAAGSPYIHTATMSLVDGAFYRGGFGPAFEGPDPQLHPTVIEMQPPAGTDATVVNAGTATLFSGFTVTGGEATSAAGGAYCPPGCTVEIRDCRFLANFAGVTGGGISIANGAAPYIHDCDFEANRASLRGGGIAVAANANQTRIEFCRVVACSAAVSGQSNGGGGGIYTASSISIADCVIDGCYSGYRAGGLYALGADVSVARSRFSNNVSQSAGGGAYLQGGDGELLQSFFDACRSVGGNGGGLSFEGGTWLVRECYVRGCIAGARGGGIYYESPVGAELRLSEVVGNRAVRGGGVGIVGNLFRDILSVHIESCTVAINSATSGGENGGGIHIFPEGNFADAIVNCIVAQQVEGSCIASEGALNQPNIRFDCVWNDALVNPSPAYGLSCADRTGINGNIKINPLFCDPTLTPPQMGLSSNSFCRGAGEGGIDLGAHPGWICGTVAVEPVTWGRIKAQFR